MATDHPAIVGQEPSPDCARRFALGVEYAGTAFNGWQIQPHAPSVQQVLNEALSRVADAPVECVGAGRTDAGVHASGQVAHFESAANRSLRSWLLGVNSHLPEEVNVGWVMPVPERFHARYSALSRSYRYRILNRPVRSALMRRRAWWVRAPLNIQAMREAAAYLLGEHDFSAFRASGCQAKSPVRNMTRFDMQERGDRIVIECQANAFLHNMVRIIVGSLVRVGSGDAQPIWVKQILDSRDRRLAGITAPAWGLCLTQVEYPEKFALPVAIR